MKTGLIAAASLTLMGALTTSAALAEQTTKSVSGASRVIFNAPGELKIRAGTDEKIVIEAEPKVLALIDATTRGDTLTISTKGSFKTDKGIRYAVTIKTFRSLQTLASGTSDIDGFSGNDVDIDLSGSGDISLKNIKATKLAIDVKNAGSVTASGSGKTVVARIDGTGNIDTTSYPAQAVEAKIAGSGTIRVNADETLNATIGGAGTIEYKGKAKVTQSVTGAGTIGRM